MEKNSPLPEKILVIRLSAIGDVAMTVPTLWSLTNQYPGTQLTFLSQGFARDIVGQIPGLLFYQADTKNRHKGFFGLFRLFRELNRLDRFDSVADLHDVLRSKVLRILFTFKGIKVVKIDKGRAEKRKLCRINRKVFSPLKSTFERYSDVFRQLGFDLTTRFDYFFDQVHLPDKLSIDLGYKSGNWIGIAPFAKHKGKIYPLDKMEKVVEHLSSSKANKLILLGGGGSEKEILDSWAEKYPNTISIARKYPILDELKIISNMDLMICMDSANMHFASLVNTPVVSIWGATHPYAGFYGWNQNPDNAVQTNLHCRPCSVYGNKSCFRNDYACLNQITPEKIINRVNTVLNRFGKI